MDVLIEHLNPLITKGGGSLELITHERVCRKLKRRLLGIVKVEAFTSDASMSTQQANSVRRVGKKRRVDDEAEPHRATKATRCETCFSFLPYVKSASLAKDGVDGVGGV